MNTLRHSSVPAMAVALVLGLAAVEGRAFELKASADFSPSSSFGASDESFDAVGKPLVDATVQGNAANNFASAHGDASAGTVGIGMSTTSSSHTYASASATLNEEWANACGTNSSNCITTVLNPVTFKIHLSGTLSPDWFAQNQYDYYGFGGSIAIADSSFSFGLGATSLDGIYVDSNGNSHQLTLASTVLPDGSLSFDETLAFNAVLGVSFSTVLKLDATWDSVTQPSSVGFLNTFGFEIVSNSDAAWTSDAGRSSIADVPVTSVPEPTTYTLTGLGLGVLALARRRRR
jgi:hypothetical protein